MTGNTAYLLYSDKTQKELYAMCYSEEEKKEETKNFTGGTWYKYDMKGSVLDNEVLIKGGRFPKKLKDVEKIESKNKKEFSWIS
jgi:hypothetical protein